MKFTVDMQTYANATIDVELSDEKFAEIAAEYEKDVKDLTLDDMREYVEEAAYHQNPVMICAQCSGWGQSYGLDLSDAWEIPEDKDAVRIKE